jgi:hypothetical protein
MAIGRDSPVATTCTVPVGDAGGGFFRCSRSRWWRGSQPALHGVRRKPEQSEAMGAGEVSTTSTQGAERSFVVVANAVRQVVL